MPIDDEAYFEWREAHMDFEESLEYCDDSLWYYLQTVEECWKTWESTDGFERYREMYVVKGKVITLPNTT